mgnify:CR=1 FL=1
MNYGINNIILESPYSLIVSIIIFLGFLSTGEIIQKFFFKKIIKKKYNLEYNYFAPITGVYVVILPLYLIVIFSAGSKILFSSISYVLFILGVIYFLKKTNKLENFSNKLNIKFIDPIIMIILLYIGLFFISASPITHADALDYHAGSAIYILNNGNFPNEILPMHYLLSSFGELIIVLGFAAKTEQLGGIIQFASLFSLIPIFHTNSKKSLKPYILLLILSFPVTLFLISSPKPQILFVISTLIIFSFLIRYFEKLSLKDSKIAFIIIVTVLACNFLTKYSFILSSFLLYFYCLYLMLKRKLFLFSMLSSIIIFIILIAPQWFFRISNFGTFILREKKSNVNTIQR